MTISTLEATNCPDLDRAVRTISAVKSWASLLDSIERHGYCPTINYQDGNADWNAAVDRVIRAIIIAGGTVYHAGKVWSKLPPQLRRKHGKADNLS